MVLLFSSSLCPPGSVPSHSVVDGEPYKNRDIYCSVLFVKPREALGEGGPIYFRELCRDATHIHKH